MKQFNVNDKVLYYYDSKFNLGVIKKIISDDEYRVTYKDGKSVIVNENQMFYIDNSDEFTIEFKKTEPSFVEPLNPRSIAENILDEFGIAGDDYDIIAGWIAEKLRGNNPDFPKKLWFMHLPTAISLQVKDYLDMNGFLYSSKDVQSIVEIILRLSDSDLLDNDFIEELTMSYGDTYLFRFGSDTDENN